MTHSISSKKTSLGFTIVELLIVVVVIAILAAITIVAYNGISKRASDSGMLTTAGQAARKLAVYYTVNDGLYPGTMAAAGLSDSGDTTYKLNINNTSPVPNYCITIKSGNKIAHVAGDRGGTNKAVLDTPCPQDSANSNYPTTITSASLGCPAGYLAVPGNSLLNQQSFCAMKYEAKQDGSGTAIAQPTGSLWIGVSAINASATAAATCATCHVLTDGEWLTIAYNALYQPSNWSGGVVGTNYMFRGHSDNTPASNPDASSNDSDGYFGTGNTSGEATVTFGVNGDSQRRTLVLSNGETIWDLAGNVREWTSQTANAANQQPGVDGGAWAARYSNTANLKMNSFVSSFPVYGNANALTWGSAQALGGFVGNSLDATLKGVIRGGHRFTGSSTGIFQADMTVAPSSATSDTGFRVAR